MGAGTVNWIASHLSWLIWPLLALWAPPLLYAIAVNLQIIDAASNGFAPLTDPALVIATVQVALMMAALPGMGLKHPRSWKLLAASLLAWAGWVAWMFTVRMRLGLPIWGSQETLWSMARLIAAAAVLLGLRRHFGLEPIALRRPSGVNRTGPRRAA
jgi:hypothetical protein